MNLKFLPLLLTLSLLGCSKGSSAPSTSTQVMTSGGTWSVAYTPNPAPVPVNAQFAMSFSLMDATGMMMTPDASAQIAPITTADAYMVMSGQRMNMPNPPTVGANSNGSVDVTDMFFPMAGDWTLVITVTKGNDSETATFTIPTAGS